jgi:hypothetical protein
MPPNDDPSPNAVREKQYELLGFIRVIKFSATPSKVRPFGTSVIAWELQVPSALTVPISVVVAGQTTHGPAGSAQVDVATTTAFGLLVKTNLVERVISTLTVTADESECRTHLIPMDAITGTLRKKLGAGLTGGSDYKVGPAGFIVTPMDDGVGLSIPLILHSGSWPWDAALNITSELEILARPGESPPTPADPVQIGVKVRSLDVGFDWTWLNDIAQHTAVAEQLSKAFVGLVMDALVAQGMAAELNSEVANFKADCSRSDRLSGGFRLTRIEVSLDGVQCVVCPNSGLRPVTPPMSPR